MYRVYFSYVSAWCYRGNRLCRWPAVVLMRGQYCPGDFYFGWEAQWLHFRCCNRIDYSTEIHKFNTL